MEHITKEDLRKLSMQILYDIEKLLDHKINAKTQNEPQEWLRSKSARRLLDGISPGTLQNIRMTGKIRFKKVSGSYYYNRTDLLKLFKDDNK